MFKRIKNQNDIFLQIYENRILFFQIIIIIKKVGKSLSHTDIL